jgi:predicted esterase
VEASVKQFYPVKVERPKGAVVRFSLDGKAWTEAGEKLPAKVTMKVPRGEGPLLDHTLTMEVTLDGKAETTRAVRVSAASEPKVMGLLGDDTLRAVQDLRGPSVELASLNERCSLLKDLADGIIPESDMPAAKRYREMNDIHAALKDDKPYFTPDRPGDHWITVPTGEKGKTLTRCRLFVPEKLDAKTPVPLVLALHGAGGSENLFFEGYGAGHIVKLCKDRGWLLVAPGSGLGFGLTPAPPFGEILDELAKRYPVDAKRIYVVGHSMGASMTVDAIQKNPGKFAAAACLGGAGTIRKAEAFDGLPLFVGVGDKDFALKSSKALHAAAEKAKAKATFKEYPDVEHLVIVREALGDVFELFDKTK